MKLHPTIPINNQHTTTNDGYHAKIMMEEEGTARDEKRRAHISITLW